MKDIAKLVFWVGVLTVEAIAASVVGYKTGAKIGVALEEVLYG